MNYYNLLQHQSDVSIVKNFLKAELSFTIKKKNRFWKKVFNIMITFKNCLTKGYGNPSLSFFFILKGYSRREEEAEKHLMLPCSCRLNAYRGFQKWEPLINNPAAHAGESEMKGLG